MPNAKTGDAAPVEIPAGASFTPAEAAKLLGITGAAVRAAVKRLGLSAEGNGKARRFPRATVETLVANGAKGCGPATSNHYTRAARGFFRWLVRLKRIGSDPLESLAYLNESVDVRRARRELSCEELRALLTATRESVSTFRGLTGEDRFFLYLVAAGTGFRANALANLTPADFEVDAAGPVVRLAARFAKNRRTKVQPLAGRRGRRPPRLPRRQARKRPGLGRDVGAGPPGGGNAPHRPGRRQHRLCGPWTGRTGVRRLPCPSAHSYLTLLGRVRRIDLRTLTGTRRPFDANC